MWLLASLLMLLLGFRDVSGASAVVYSSPVANVIGADSDPCKPATVVVFAVVGVHAVALLWLISLLPLMFAQSLVSSDVPVYSCA